jgi:glycosyltransferase involved in cell wall biosynthesis
MKVGILATLWSPDWDFRGGISGAKIAGVGLLKALLLHAHQVEVFDVFVPPPLQSAWLSFQKWIRRSGVPEERLHLRPATDLPKVLRQETFLAFHGSPPPDWNNLLALRHFARDPFVCTATMYGISYDFLLPQLATAFLRGVSSADSLICATHVQKEALLRLLGRACPWHGTDFPRLEELTTLIPLGVDAKRFMPSGEKLTIRSWLGLPEDGTLLLSLGRLSPGGKADLIPLLRAFGIVRKSIPSAWLVIAGEEGRPGVAERLSQYAHELNVADRVIILPSIPESIKPALYNAADVFVALSDTLQETFGIVLLEAMACGLPVVAADWDGYREVVTEGETGYLVPTWWAKCDEQFNLLSALSAWEVDHFYLAQSVPLDSEMLVERLLQLLRDSTLRREIGLKGRERVEQNFSWELIVPQYESLWFNKAQVLNSAPLTAQPLLPRYWETFRHYAAHQLNLDTWVSLTDFGHLVLEGRESLVVYEEMSLILDDTLLDFFMNRLTQGRQSVEVLCREVSRHDPSWSEEQMTYHLLWLAKQGVVSFRPSSG